MKLLRFVKNDGKWRAVIGSKSSFGDFRNRIVQGVDEQGFPVIASNRIDIIGNGGNPDPATPREGRRLSGCKLLLPGTKDVTVPGEKATANYVPAAAVIRRWQALSGFTGCKGRAAGNASQM